MAAREAASLVPVISDFVYREVPIVVNRIPLGATCRAGGGSAQERVLATGPRSSSPTLAVLYDVVGHSSIFKAVEAVAKGIEIPLPAGHSFVDKDGIARCRVRVRWWDQNAITYRSAAMLAWTHSVGLPDAPIPDHARIAMTDKPLFFGHYWLTDMPSLQSDRCACVDYSAGSGGALVAYRFDGELELSNANFVWVT